MLTTITEGRFLSFCTVALRLRFMWFGAHADFVLPETLHIYNEFKQMCVCLPLMFQKSCCHEWFGTCLYETRFAPRGSRSRNHAFQFIHIFPMYFQWFHVNVLCCFSKVHKMRASRSQLDTLHGPRVHEISLCVTYAASRFGTNFRALSQRSKYVMFPITCCAPVLQTTLCVAFAARRVCVLLGRPDSKM